MGSKEEIIYVCSEGLLYGRGCIDGKQVKDCTWKKRRSLCCDKIDLEQVNRRTNSDTDANRNYNKVKTMYTKKGL